MNVEQLKSQLEQIAARVELVLGRGEEATKQALVLPMLSALGYDIWNPSQVCPEYDADFAVRKGSQKERVDLALLLDGVPRVFIEVKAADVKLSGHAGQLSRYFNSVPTVSLGILTNGREYQFFTDTAEPNMMDSAPFHIADVESVDLGLEVLAKFHRSRFSPSGIRDYASDLIFTSALEAFLKQELDLGRREPSDELVRWVLGSTSVYDGRLVASAIDRFRPLVKLGLQRVLRDIVRRSVYALDQGVAADEPAATANQDDAVEMTTNDSSSDVSIDGASQADQEHAQANQEQTAKRRSSAVNTTEDELEAYAILLGHFQRSTLANAMLVDPTTRKESAVEFLYKDTTGYFGIYINKPSWWIARLNLDAKQPWIGVNLSEEAVDGLAPDHLERMPATAFADVRFAISGPADLHALAPLLHKAAEELIAARQPDDQ